MKFVVNRDLFTRALARIQGVVSRKATMPVLSNVLLEATGADQLRVAATDLDVTFDGQLAARTTEPGRITVDGKRLFEVVRSLPGEEVDVEVGDEERVTLRCKNTEFVLLGMSADSYPKLPSLEGLELVDADGSVLRELLERTMFSVSTDESRPNLNGVYFRCLGDDRIRMVSTDGHRLSQGERAAGRGATIPERDGVIIPRKGVTELKRLLDEVGAEIAFGFLENNLVVSAGDLSLFVRLIDANFPDYRQVIPKSSERHVVLQRVPFLNSLKRIEILISNNPDLGSAREEVAVEGYDGGELVIAFNAKYMREILGILSAEKVELALNEALSPGLIREHENQDYLFVVMPMRI